MAMPWFSNYKPDREMGLYAMGINKLYTILNSQLKEPCFESSYSGLCLFKV